MAKIRQEHLPHLAREIELALREGTITVAQAKEFSDAMFTAALKQQAQPCAVTPKGNNHVQTIRREGLA